MMSGSKKRVATESDPPKEEVVETVRTGSDMSGLPPEIILKILSNLSHGNQLWARLVCRQWNKLITTDPQFLNKSVIRVCVNTNNRDIVLKNSVVRWRHLYLKDLESLGNVMPVILPLYLRKDIQTVKISQARLRWKEFQKTLVQFPSLQGLKISRSEVTWPSVRGGWKLTHSKLQSEFETTIKGITSFAVSHVRGGMMDILVRFLGNLPVLTAFELKYESDGLPEKFFEFIESVSPTLKNLWIKIRLYQPQFAINSFVRHIQRLNESEIVKTSLNLETFFFRYPASYSPYPVYTTKELRTLLDFVKMNKNLKRICGLPENNSNLTTDLAREFIRELPQDLVGIDVPGSNYLSAQGNLLRVFEKLESIEVGEDIRPSDLNLDGQVLPGVKVFKYCHLQYTMDMQLVVHAFPNLVKLYATIFEPIGPLQSSRDILQEICQHMNLLILLDLTFGGNSEIEDSGVTGISKLYCTQLGQLAFESLTALKDDPIPEENMTGCPLSSLRRLEKLTIRAHHMNISNVGLCFGFRFRGLKKLSLINITDYSQTQTTPRGLGFIADYNRSLEEVLLDNVVRVNPGDVVASEEVQTFKNRMDRCKSFRMKITWNYLSDDDEDDVILMAPPYMNFYNNLNMSDVSGTSDSDD